MGPAPRGGAYTYDWIENLLGLDMHSVDRVLPEYQDPQLGDAIGFGSNRMRLERLDPERVLAWRSEDGDWVWTFVIETRRQVTAHQRNRFRLPTLIGPWDAADGARLVGDGTQDAAGDQAARRAPRVRASHVVDNPHDGTSRWTALPTAGPGTASSSAPGRPA